MKKKKNTKICYIIKPRPFWIIIAYGGIDLGVKAQTKKISFQLLYQKPNDSETDSDEIPIL